MSLLRTLLLTSGAGAHKRLDWLYDNGNPWDYRKKIPIDGVPAGEQTDYQVKFVVHRRAGTDLNEDVYVGTKCRMDYGDLRFTKADGVTKLDYCDEVGILDEWIDRTDLPVGRSDVTACAINGKMYVFGGYSGAVKFPECYEYDPATDAWTQMDDMPTKRWGAIAVSYDGKAYVFGGADVVFLDVLEIFDPTQTAGNQWSSGSVMPYTGQGMMGVYFPDDGLIHLFGGEDGVAFRDYHFTYNPSTDLYDTAPTSMPAARNWGTCAVVGSNIYVIGGAQAGPVGTDTTWRYNPPPADDWTVLTAMPGSRWGATRENPVIDDKIYVAHGQHPDDTYHTTVYEYDVASDSWDTKLPGSNARDGHGCAVIDNTLYIVAGRENAVGLSHHEAYRLACVFWVELDTIPIAPGSATICVYYGNSGAVSESDGSATFPYFDDFNNGAIDPMWTQDFAGAPETITERVVEQDIDFTRRLNIYCHLESAMILDSCALLVKLKAGTESQASYSLGCCVWFNQYDYAAIKLYNQLPTLPYEIIAYYDKDASAGAIYYGDDTWVANLWKFLQIRVTATTVYFDESHDGLTWNNIGSTARPATWDTPDLAIVGTGYERDPGSGPNPDWDNSGVAGASSHVYADEYFIRNYVFPEPSYGTWGSEETP